MRGFLTIDAAVAEIATHQHGVVALAQLRAAGWSDDAVVRRARAGRLHRVHRGVYAVGHRRLGAQGHLWAALLAVPGGALSHRTAAAVWDLCPLPSGRLDVTTTGAARSTRELRVHRTTRLDVAVRDGLRVTSVAQTLRDRARANDPRLERLVARAEHHRLLDAGSLAEQFDQPGGRRLRDALDALAHTGPNPTRSELEERLLDEIARAGLPRPQVNARVEGYEVDFVWRERRLVAETDGVATHLTATAFESDRARDARLVSAGWRVVRFTWRQVDDGSAARTLRRLL